MSTQAPASAASTASPAARPRRHRATPLSVSIVGGTGLLGHQAALACRQRGHAVQCIGSSEVAPGCPWPDAITLRQADVFRMPKRQLARLFVGVDAMVYAVGPDDRVVPPAPAYDFFHERLVRACARAVSYTHLDVYKRQRSASSQRPILQQASPAFEDSPAMR